jgi:PIN domain nuclease of toxin-antitoxin system
MVNLDSSVLLHALAGQVTAREENILVNENWGISAAVLWELAEWRRTGRISLDLGSAEVARLLAQVHVWPIDVKIAAVASELELSDDASFADRMIAATSVVHKVPLLTRDARLKKFVS